MGYRGDSFFCPICNSFMLKFKSGNCPFCGSGLRHRVLWLFLSRKTDFFNADLSVLHFAPEHCFYKFMKKLPNIRYLTADLSSPRAMVKMDISDIHFPDNSYDVILSSHVLEHVDNDLKAMKELHRVQKDNGWSIHSVPIDYSRYSTFENPLIISSNERFKIFGHFDHRRIYGRDYSERLESAGFKVTIFKTSDFCNENEIRNMGLIKDAEIFYCTK